jgi:hypothetical protein
MLCNDDKKFVFVHIQKTAGSSMRHVLKKIPGTKRICGTHSFIKDCDYPKDYFKFVFVRNPWDRLVSWYNMHKKLGPHNDFAKYLIDGTNNFSDFLKKTNVVTDYPHNSNFPVRKSITYNQLDYVSDEDEKIIVDFIGKFENLNEDVSTVGKKIGLPNMKLPVVNKLRNDDYRTYYKDNDVEIVAEMYKRDIEYFGYTF